MSRYFIELSDSPADRLYLKDSEVDTVNYDNNYGYTIYVLEDLEGKFCLRFPSESAREYYVEENGLDDLAWNHKVNWDAYESVIWEENGDRESELCECTCDVDSMFLDMSF